MAGAASPELREYLERRLVSSLVEKGAGVARIYREPTRFASSYGAEVIVAELSSGEKLRIFLKNFGETAFRKDAARDRRERELHVYRDLLPEMRLGTAAFYGCLWDEASKRFWLLLEYVEGAEVRHCPLNGWISAAGWVGRLHGTKRRLDRLQSSPLLVRHDAAYFHGRAEMALADATSFGEPLADRLRRVVDAYRPVVEEVTSQPRCLVHGGYRPGNVLLSDADGERRICPIDWELAALGSPLYDLATFVDGFEPPELDLLLGAYIDEALAHGASVAERDELRRLVRCFRLARVLDNLARARRSGYREGRVAKLVSRAARLHEELVGGTHGIGIERDGTRGRAWLEEPIRRALRARSVRVLSCEPLKGNVHRVRAEVNGRARSLVAKRSQPEVARRNWLVARRWLQAARLDGSGPPILGVAAEPGGDSAWHVYEDLPGQPLSREDASDADVTAVLEAIARVHVSFAEHPLLRECRLWGGDRGIAFYSGNVSDAISALRALEPEGTAGRYRGLLLDRMERLRAEEGRRRETLTACGGPETLLHGDLWTTNAILVRSERAADVRLVDWDEAAVGPAAFDVSTFVLQFNRARRPWVLDRYRKIVGRLAGWELADDGELDAAFATVAYARLASLLVWTLAGADARRGSWLPGWLADMVDWLNDVEPVLADR